MKKCFLFLIIYICSGALQAQVSTNGGSGLSLTYPSLSAAITALNSATITSPVTITITGNETAPAGGYAITQLGGTAANTIVISGSSSTITAGLQTAGSQTDAIFKIIGGDYITIQNFTMQENAGNTVTSHATNTMTEFGVALFIASATDGAQNNTIQNNTITLSSSYQDAIGIFSTCSSASDNSALAATSTAGTNSNNKFYSNIISGVAWGMYFICEPVTSGIFESGIDIGGSSSATANTITFGIATASTLTWTRFTGTQPAGIYFQNGGAGDNIRYNSITSNSLSYPQTGGPGGVITSFSAAATGVTYTSTWSNNILNLTNNAKTPLTGIDFGYGLSTGAIACNNNRMTITNSQTATTSATAAIFGIKANYATATNTANGNSVTINQTFSPSSTTSNSGPLTGITLAGASTTLTANTDTVTIKQTNSPTGAYTSTLSGTAKAINLSAAATTINCNKNNILFNQIASLQTGGISNMTDTLFGIFANVASTTVNIGSSGNANTIGAKQTPSGPGTSNFTNAVIYIYAPAAHGTLNIAYNILNNNSSSLRTTGATIGINHNGSIATALGITNNNINLNRVGTSGTLYGIYSAASTAISSGYNVNSNTITLTSSTNGVTSAVYNTDGTAVKNFNSNTINISGSATAIYDMYLGNGTCNAASNSFTIATSGISPTILGIDAVTSGTFNISSNTFPSISASITATSAPTISLIRITTGTNNTIYSNTLANVSTGASTGSATISGIEITGGTSTSVYKNKFYGLTTGCKGTSTIINGILISGGTLNNVYNNLIGFTNSYSLTLVNSVEAIVGINITSSTANSNNNIYYNTIDLNASSTGSNFGTAGIYHAANATSTTSALDLRNNIIVNTSAANGSGLTVAFRRSSNQFANFATTSNNNLFYAGTPGTSYLIYYDGTNSEQYLNDYRALVSPNDALSISENPNWVSISGSAATYLHINTSIATGIESGGANIATYTDDYDGDIRQGNAGYTGSGTAPDIGADEFNGNPLPRCSGTPASSNINGQGNVCYNTGTLLSLSTTYTDAGITYQWGYSTTSGGPYTNLGTSSTQPTGNLTSTTYFVCTITCSYGNLYYTTPEKTVIVNGLPTIAITPASANYCTPGGSALPLTASGAVTYSWSPSAGLSATSGATVNANPIVNTIYTVTGTDGNGCTNTSTTQINVDASVYAITTATPDSICSGQNSQLLATGVQSFTTPQAPDYVFSSASGIALQDMSSASILIGSDEILVSSAVTNIGFVFNFGGVNYSQFSASSEGLLGFGSAAVTSSDANNSTTYPTIMPAWDDMNTGSLGNVRYLLNTAAGVGNRILVVEWNYRNISESGQYTKTVQVWLYESTNQIKIIYGANNGFALVDASVGIVSSGGYNDVNTSSGLNNTTTPQNSNTVFPDAGTAYIFTPAGAPVLTYAWSPSSFISSQETLANPLATAVTSTTAYMVTVTGNSGCSTSGNISLNVMIIGTAGAISGLTNQAPDLSGQIYSITPVNNATYYTWTVPTGWTITGGQGTSAITVTTGATGQNGNIGVTAGNNCGTTQQSLAVTVSQTNKTLNLTSVLLEGLYLSNGTMSQAKDETGNAHWNDGSADHISVELHDPNNYSNIIYSTTDVPLSTNGAATIIVPGIYNASYFITIRHRNSLETTTDSPVSFDGNTINQSFGDPSDIYFGNLGSYGDGYYFIYGGDVNQDGFVDTGDYTQIDNDSYNGLQGYLVSDVNGDGWTDTGDYTIVDNNSYNGIMVFLP